VQRTSLIKIDQNKTEKSSSLPSKSAKKVRRESPPGKSGAADKSDQNKTEKSSSLPGKSAKKVGRESPPGKFARQVRCSGQV
jgi:hypothetical protein